MARKKKEKRQKSNDPESDCEELARIDVVAILNHPDEIEFLEKFGNQRVRNKLRQYGVI